MFSSVFSGLAASISGWFPFAGKLPDMPYEIPGTDWVPADTINPHINVYRRRFRTDKGRIGIYCGRGFMDEGERITHWWA